MGYLALNQAAGGSLGVTDRYRQKLYMSEMRKDLRCQRGSMHPMLVHFVCFLIHKKIFLDIHECLAVKKGFFLMNQ